MGKLTHGMALGLILLMTAGVFVRVTSHEFVNVDDAKHLDANPAYRKSFLMGIKSHWIQTHLMYMPVVYSIWSFPAAVSDNSKAFRRNLHPVTHVSRVYRFKPFLFHLTNLVFHLLNTVLVFLILKRFFPQPFAVFVGTLFFAMHPLQVEPVAWVSGLKDLSAGFFALFSMLLYLLFCKKSERDKKSNKTPLVLYVSSALCFYLAVLAKITMVLLPIGIALLVVLELKRPLKKVVLELGVWLVLPIPVVVSFFSKLPKQFSTLVPKVSYWERPLIALETLGFYLQKILLPYPILIDHGRNPEVVAADSMIALKVLVPLGAIIGVIYFAKKGYRRGLFVLGFFLLMVLPVLGFEPFLFQAISTFASRYAYLPLFGVAFGVALFAQTGNQLKSVRVGLCLWLVLLAVRSYDQTLVWRDSVSLWQHNLKHNPRSWFALNNLGAAYERKREFKEALSAYQKAVAIKPLPRFYSNVGSVHAVLGDYRKAVESFEQALKINALAYKNHTNVGMLWERLGETFKAKEAFEKALSIKPRYGPAVKGFDRVRSIASE